MILPREFQSRMQELLKEEYTAYLDSFDHTVGQSLRVNHFKTEPADLIRRLHAVYEDVFWKIDWCPDGFRYGGDSRLSRDPYYYAGLYYLQEPSAMAPAALLPVEPGDRVLDLCAAPGGKTTALLAALSGRGVLLANDVSRSRCKALLKNIQLSGIPGAVVSCEQPDRLVPYFPEYFDKILVDAPCSGEGMFRKDPAMVRSWSFDAPDRYSAIQKDILQSARKMLRPGGLLMYSTCTYAPEENEQVVETLLKEGDFQLLLLPDFPGVDRGRPEWTSSKDPSLTCCLRFWNHRIEGEGQFAALLRKSGFSEKAQEEGVQEKGAQEERVQEERVQEERVQEEGAQEEKAQEEKAQEEGAARSKEKEQSRIPGRKPLLPAGFLRELLQAGSLPTRRPDRIQQLGDRIFLIPEGLPDLSGLRLVSSGLPLGVLKAKRFEPSHALALALSPHEFDNSLVFSREDDRVDRYLRGESIPVPSLSGQKGVREPEEGWCLVCLKGGYPLGWGKIQKGRLKNKYPPAWRRV